MYLPFILDRQQETLSGLSRIAVGGQIRSVCCLLQFALDRQVSMKTGRSGIKRTPRGRHYHVKQNLRMGRALPLNDVPDAILTRTVLR